MSDVTDLGDVADLGQVADAAVLLVDARREQIQVVVGIADQCGDDQRAGSVYVEAVPVGVDAVHRRVGDRRSYFDGNGVVAILILQHDAHRGRRGALSAVAGAIGKGIGHHLRAVVGVGERAVGIQYKGAVVGGRGDQLGRQRIGDVFVDVVGQHAVEATR